MQRILHHILRGYDYFDFFLNFDIVFQFEWIWFSNMAYFITKSYFDTYPSGLNASGGLHNQIVHR